MAVLALAVAVTGFAGTYFAPMAAGTFQGPPILHVHGVLLFGWLVLFLAQSALVLRRDIRLHRRLGWAGLAVAIGVTASTIATGVWATQRDIAAGGGGAAVSGIVGTVMSALMFAALVGAAVIWRRDAAAHKRLMMLATVAILWPAWFRFRHYFPFVPAPEWTFAVIVADSLIVACILHDWLVERRIHPVYLFAGPAIILEHVTEVIMFDSPPWRAFGHFIFDLLT